MILDSARGKFPHGSTMSGISIFTFQSWFYNNFLHPPTSDTDLEVWNKSLSSFLLSHMDLCNPDFDFLYLVCFPFVLDIIINLIPSVNGIFITVSSFPLFTNYSYSIYQKLYLHLEIENLVWGAVKFYS